MGNSKYLDPMEQGSKSNKALPVFGLLALLIVVFGVLAFSGKLDRFFQSDNNGTAQSSQQTASATTNLSGGSATTTSGSTVNRGSRQLPAVQPLNESNAVTKGGAMLGPSGTYLYVSKYDGSNHRLVKKELRKELINEGIVPKPEEFKKGLIDFIDQMFNNGVSNKKYIQFMVSSGAMKQEAIQQLVKSIEDSGYVVTKTSVEEEGQYALEAVMSPQQRANSFLVDLTPTVTRLSWYTDTGKTRTLELPGSKYFQDGTTEAQAMAALTEKLKELPQKNRENGFIIWGAADKLHLTSARYEFLEDTYNIGEDRLLKSGLGILYAVQSQTGTPLIFDWESAYPVGFVARIK